MTDLPTGTVTFLFTDVEGSTRLLQEIGATRYAEVRAEHHRLLRDACDRHAGVEVDTAGDGFFVAFPTAAGAVAAAAEAQRALSGLVAVRMGLHSGEPVLTPDGYAGIDVHRAARIAAAACGGQILASRTTCDLVAEELPDGVSVRDLGEHRLKDLSRPQQLFQLVVEGLPHDFPPPRTLSTRSTNLPSQTTPLIGRTHELKDLADLLRLPERRLITLTGPGGSGKTRLALHAAADAVDDFRDGVFVVRLEGLDEPTLVVSAIAQVLDLGSREDATPEQLVVEHLQGRNILLVLDNFEHVLDAAPLVARLLADSSELRFLVTSTAPLRISHETEFPVPPLAVPRLTVGAPAELRTSGAVTLFAERARAARPSFELTDENAGAVAAICVGVGGLPLAIELAAARARILSPEALLARLETPLALLTGGGRDVPDRHRTLRATIDWSYRLLDHEHQQLFSRLAVFAGGFTLEAVERICRPQDELGLDAVEGLARLVEASMLTSGESADSELRMYNYAGLDASVGDASKGPIRARRAIARHVSSRDTFAMLETLHAYAREKLGESGGLEPELRRRHAEYFLGDLDLVESFFEPFNDAWRQFIANLERELENVRVALEWAHRARSPLELGLAVLYQRSARVFPGEGREVLGRALTNDDGRRPRLRARALAAAGGLARAQVDLEAAQACLDESLRLYREAGDWEGETWILTWLAGLATDRGDLEEAVRLAQERVAIARLMGDTRRLGYALNWLAYFSLAQGEYAEARTQLAEGASLAEGYVTPFSAVLRAYVELLDGDRIQAVGIVAAVLTDLRPDEEQWFGWVLVDDLAAMLAGADEMNTAVQLYAAAASWFRSRGTRTDDMPRQLREKTHGPLERASDAPAFESAAEGGSRMSYDDAVANGLAAAQRVAARS